MNPMHGMDCTCPECMKVPVYLEDRHAIAEMPKARGSSVARSQADIVIEDGKVVKDRYNQTGAFVTKDSGERKQFASGMVRDVVTGKTSWHKVVDGPMLERWAQLLTRGAVKYPDVKPGVPNWTLADGPEEEQRFKESAFRHFMQWYRGDTDEDHAAAVFFNINGLEFLRRKFNEKA